MILNKYDGDNHQLINTYLGDFGNDAWAYTVTVDKDDYVYMGGDINLPYTYEYILKFTNDLEDIEWKLTDHYLTEGTIMSLTTMGNGCVVAMAFRYDLSSPGADCFYTKIFNSNGYLLLEIIEGGDWEGSHMYAEGYGVATDSDDNIIATGARIYYDEQEAYMYTMKYNIVMS